MTAADINLDLETTPWEVHGGRELLVHGPDGTPYAGAWLQELLQTTDDSKILLGHFEDPVRGPYEPATIPISALFRHTAYVGKTGYGLSTALALQFAQLSDRGFGLGLIDGTGDLTCRLLQSLSDDRFADVRVVTPTTESGGYNLLATRHAVDEAGYDHEERCILATVRDYLLGGESGAPETARHGQLVTDLVEPLCRVLIRDDEPHTIATLLDILSDASELVSSLDSTGDGIDAGPISELRASIEAVDEATIAPICTRLRHLIESPTLRRVIATRDGHAPSTLFSPDHLVLIDLSGIDRPQERQFIGTILTNALWTAHQTATDDRPYVLFLDYTPLLGHDSLRLSDMLAKGRSRQFGITMTLTELDQLPAETRDVLFASVGNIYSFNPRHPSSNAHRLAQAYGIGVNRLLDLPIAQFVGSLYSKDGDVTGPFDITTFPPVVPRRSLDTAVTNVESW